MQDGLFRAQEPQVKLFVLAGFLAFFVASLTVGIRLVRLFTRTRKLPELLIGIGVLGIGPVGFGLATVGLVLGGSHPGLAQALFATAFLAVAIGAEAKYVFNWRVYHPRSPAARAVAWSAGIAFALVYAWDLATTGFADPYAVNAGYVVRSALQVGCLLWGAAEALVYWRRMRRRSTSTPSANARRPRVPARSWIVKRSARRSRRRRPRSRSWSPRNASFATRTSDGRRARYPSTPRRRGDRMGHAAPTRAVTGR